MTMENFLIAQIAKEEELFTTKEEKGPNNDTRTVVKFSKAKPKKDDSTTTAVVIKHIDASLEIVKGCLKIGAFVVPQVAPILSVMVETATFLQGTLKLVPDDTEDPVDKKLKELEKSIFELEKKMNAQFADLHSFITEVEFTIEVINEASTLMKYMRDVLKYRSPEATQNFRDAYDQNSPLILAYTLGCLLERKSTNPIRMEMEPKGKTKEAFEKWEKCIGGVMGQLMFLEAFAAGLLKNKSHYNWDRIVEQTKIVQSHMDKLREDFKKDEKYWDEMKVYMENYMIHNTGARDDYKAEEILKKLDSYLTTDSFEVIIFNTSDYQKDYTYQCLHEKTQLIEVRNKGDRCALVYRSKEAYRKSASEADALGQHIKECGNNVLSYNGKFDDTIQKQLIETKKLEHYGFICLVKTTKDVHIRGLDNRWAGRNLVVNVKNTSDGKTYDHHLIVSFE